jgi:hypothetical protein
MTGAERDAYVRKQCAEAQHLIMHKGDYDPDAWILRYLRTTISPYSLLWRHGVIKALGRAIRLIESAPEKK